MTSADVDLVIVGAGPAGLVAANRAAELGLRVKLFERQYEIGYPVRTSGGSYIKEMTENGIPSQFYNPLKSVTFATTNKRVQFDYPSHTACVLDIRGAYQFLAMEAAKKGCEIEVGTTVQGAIKENGLTKGVVALYPRGKDADTTCRTVIDASGFSSVIARDSGLLPPSWERFGSGVEYEAYVEHLEKESALLLVGENILPTGYGWIFPLSEHRGG